MTSAPRQVELRFNPVEIDRKWQERWAKDNLYHVDDNDPRPKWYDLTMYPIRRETCTSGTGMPWRPRTATLASGECRDTTYFTPSGSTPLAFRRKMRPSAGVFTP